MPVYINKNGQQSGPYEDHVVIDQLQNGSLSPNDLGVKHGESSWKRLGDMFPDVGIAEPTPVAGGASAASTPPPPKKGGCLKAGLLATGLVFLILGIGVAAGSRFVPSVSCRLAGEEAAEIDKLKVEYDKAKNEGDSAAIRLVQFKLNQSLSSADASQRNCNDDKFRDNLIGGAGVVSGAVGFLMTLIGLFVGRKK